MLKWIGYLKGVEGLDGIPARDLSEDEVEQYGGEAALVATGLYGRPHEARPAAIKPKRAEVDQETHEPAND